MWRGLAMTKPTEVRIVAALLEEEAESATDLAKRIIDALDQKRETDDQTWVVVHVWRSIVTCLGPYATRNAAEKAASKQVSPGPEDSRVFARLIRKEYQL